jgi:periplasmic divalent cation tolerance protein
MTPEVLLVISTFPDAETAGRIASELVTEKLAACANIAPSVQSIYRWQGKVEEASEAMVFFKTTAGCFEQFQIKLRSLHPYDVPEIIALRVADGLPDYLSWVEESCL